MKNPVVITMLVIAVLLIGGVVAVFLVFNVFDREAAPAPAPVPAPVPAAVPAPASAPAPAPAPAPSGPSIEDKIKSLEQTIEQVRTTGQPQEVTIVLTEAEVNAQAQSLAQGQQSAEFKVLSVRIDLQPNNALSAELQAQTLGFTIPIRVNMNIGVKDDKPAVSITDINLPVPQTMKDQIAAAIAQSIDSLMVEMTQGGVGAGVAFEVRSITIRETDMTIVALVKPA
jgi:hypothetical protein